MSRTLIADVETTGFIEPIEVVEMAWLELDSPGSLRILNRFEQRYRPSKAIEYGALATHHIMDEDLRDCPPSREAVLPAGVDYVIGHNVDYDAGPLGAMDLRRIDTCALAHRCWPECDSFSQGALLYFLRRGDARECLRSAHSAAADCENTLELLRHIVGRIKNAATLTWEGLWKASEIARIPTHWAFGKHKGKLIAEAPWDYREWCLKQADMDPYVITAVKQSMRTAAPAPALELEPIPPLPVEAAR